MENRIAIIGLGYVGLPLAVEFARKYHTLGFDINPVRIAELMNGKDSTLEVEDALLGEVLRLKGDNQGLRLSTREADLANYNVYIITVPTPVDRHNHPDLTPLYKASETVGKYLEKGDIVIYESTVYPGVTEDECVPVLEQASGLAFNKEFYCGYSPERINPGDKTHTVTKIKKVTSGSTPAVAKRIDEIYKSIIIAGTHLAPSIKVAEAAKVIENAQRDINIAFVNELSKIFNYIGIDTQDVLDAAATKWNFLPFKPGLVGGHCIGVDPYYLAQKAQELGYHPEIILAGRRLNDSMGPYVAGEVVKLMVKKDIPVVGANVLMLGIAFKENCPDIRNSRAIDIYHELKKYHIQVDVYDPWVSKKEVEHEYGIDVLTKIKELGTYNAIILAVAHKDFLALDLEELKANKAIVFDVKAVLPRASVDARL
jgi:UDP-N-acetyl-D-galactosamine dehydrogenase